MNLTNAEEQFLHTKDAVVEKFKQVHTFGPLFQLLLLSTAAPFWLFDELNCTCITQSSSKPESKAKDTGQGDKCENTTQIWENIISGLLKWIFR